MVIKQYDSLQDFTEEYLYDYSEVCNHQSFLAYLRDCLITHQKREWELKNKELNLISEYDYQNIEIFQIKGCFEYREIFKEYFEHELSEKPYFFFTDFSQTCFLSREEFNYYLFIDTSYAKFIREELEFNCSNLSILLKNLPSTDLDKIQKLLHEIGEQKQRILQVRAQLKELKMILKFIESKIIEEKFNVIRSSNASIVKTHSGTIDSQPSIDANVDKAGLLIRSGIIGFLRKNNPGISDRRLAYFLKEMSVEDAESFRPHITKNIDSLKNPFNAKPKKYYDDLLLKFGIHPLLDFNN